MTKRPIPKHIRKAVFKKHGKECKKCKCKEGLHIHHIFPEALGGTEELDNLVPLCNECHMDYHKRYNYDYDLRYFDGEYTHRKAFEQFLNLPNAKDLMYTLRGLVGGYISVGSNEYLDERLKSMSVYELFDIIKFSSDQNKKAGYSPWVKRRYIGISIEEEALERARAIDITKELIDKAFDHATKNEPNKWFTIEEKDYMAIVEVEEQSRGTIEGKYGVDEKVINYKLKITNVFHFE